MEIKQISIKDLNPAAYNPRKISREGLGSLKKGIKEFGLVDPIIINKDMTIIGGHQRYKACLELGFTELPCIVMDLSKSKEKALNLVLNKITGEWNTDKLEFLLKGLDEIDLDLTGFNAEELGKYIEDLMPQTAEYDIAPRVMESYDYIVLFFENTLDFQVACDHFGVKIMQEDVRKEIGLGKAVDGAAYLKGLKK